MRCVARQAADGRGLARVMSNHVKMLTLRLESVVLRRSYGDAGNGKDRFGSARLGDARQGKGDEQSQ